MKKIRLKILVILIILPLCTYAQLRIDNITKGEMFSFPLVVSDDSKVADKINTYLQLGELELIKGYEERHIFEKVSRNDGTIYGGKTSIAYEIITNNKTVLSISFNQVSCGMTCTYWFSYYNFNPKNGDRYFLHDFFNAKDYKKFKQIVAKKRIANLNKQIHKVKEEEYREPFRKGVALGIEEDDLRDFYFTKDSIYFDNFNMLGKHDKYHGINHITPVAIADIAHLLNEFGKSALITGNYLAGFHSTGEPQLYKGKIAGKYEIILLYNKLDFGDILGIYAYSRYGIGINLRGEQKDGKYFFEEKNEERETTGKIVFIKKENRLSGMWTDKEEKRKLTFELERY